MSTRFMVDDQSVWKSGPMTLMFLSPAQENKMQYLGCIWDWILKYAFWQLIYNQVEYISNVGFWFGTIPFPENPPFPP